MKMRVQAARGSIYWMEANLGPQQASLLAGRRSVRQQMMIQSRRSRPERPRRGRPPLRLSRPCCTSWTRLQRKLPGQLPETPLLRSSLQAQVLHLQS